MPGAILHAVVGNLVVAAALGAAVCALGRRTRRPALVHAAWLLVLVKLLTPPLFTLPVRCLPGEPAARPAAAAGAAPTRAAALPGATSPVPARLPMHADPAAAPSPAMPGAGPTLSASAPRASAPVPWEEAVLLVWATGSIVWLAILSRRIRQFVRLLRFATPAPPELVEDVATVAAQLGLRGLPRVRVLLGVVPPFVWAAWRPTLYFPADLLKRLSTQGRLTLLAHELAHLRRRDHVVRWVEFVALAFYWWCPLAWLARSELRRLEEEACDAEVGATLPGTAYAYASAVLETIDFLAGARRVPALASAVGQSDSLRRRLVLILGTQRSARPTRTSRLVFGAAAVLLLAAGLKAERFAASEAAADPSLAQPAATIDAPPARTADEAPAGVTLLSPTPTALLAAEMATLGRAPCLAAGLSPDGRRLAVACGAGVTVWDLASRRVQLTLAGHGDAVNAVAFSPNGTRIATAGSDGVAKLWDAADGRPLHTLAGHGSWVTALAFAPDGRTVATGGYDKMIRLWDVATGRLRATWVGHTGGVRALAFAPDGGTLASGGADCEVRVWDVATGAVGLTLKKHTGPIRAVAFAPDGRVLATTSEDRTLRLWEVGDAREAAPPLTLPDHGTALGFAPGGQALLVGTLGGHLLNVDPVAGQLRQFVGFEAGGPGARAAHADAVVAVLAPGQGRALYSMSQDQTVLGWKPAGAPRPAPPAYRAGRGAVTAVALSPDGRTLATGGRDGIIRLWDVAAGTERTTLPGHPGGVTALRFASAGRLVSAGADERVRAWDLTSGRAVGTVIQATDDLRIALSPDGRTVAIVGAKVSGVLLWDLKDGGPVRQLGETADAATAAAFTPAGDRLATGYADGKVRLWELASGDEVRRGQAGRGQVDAIAFGPGGTTAAVVLNGAGHPEDEADPGPVHEVVFWDARDGSVREAPRPLRHPGPITAAAFTADAGRLLTAAQDGNLYLWDLPAGKVAGTIRGHAGPVRGVALAPDGTAVFSAGDRAARRWPMPTPPTKESVP
jgi:WD40 repeat protein/beta-lactamase regulating signal transducer with metallopeptidase domain